MENPKQINWQALKQMLYYLLDTQDMGITINKSLNFDLCDYCEVDWGGDQVDKRSQSGFLIQIETLISWF